MKEQEQEQHAVEETLFLSYCFTCNHLLTGSVSHDDALNTALDHQRDTGHAVILQEDTDVTSCYLLPPHIQKAIDESG